MRIKVPSFENIKKIANTPMKFSLRPVPHDIKSSPFQYLFLTWFCLGRIRPASGTWGTLGALPFAYFILTYYNEKPFYLFMAAIIVFVVGVVLTSRYIAITDTDDPGEIVVDEVVGIWIALLPALMNPYYWVLAFVLFRFFDIVKLGPVKYFDEKVPGGLGVMMDDVMAGIMAGLTILLLRALFKQVDVFTEMLLF